MSLERIENTSLWKNALANVIEDESYLNNKREELRVALKKFRNNASIVVSQISKSLPKLTQHEISHLDALWETASLISGDNYPLNPLEAFVLGGSILLHDSALSYDVYKDG